MNQKVYITTSIPYVNSHPHVGHAQEFVIADAIARLYKQSGYQTHLQTGTDENALKNVISARAQGISAQALVDRNAAAFRDLADRLHVDYQSFLRTTDQKHREGVTEFFSRLKKDDLYSSTYSGLYCVGCEDFYREEDLIDGLCPDHRKRPEEISEENLYFRLSRYQDRLLDLISRDEIRIIPEFRKNEVLSFIRRGLQDISITRSKARSEGWGIEAPGHPDQVIYVWIDALINYVSGVGFESWSEDQLRIHVIGKNVWKFHTVYWPALLLSAGLALPSEIVVHGFLTTDGVKISKSLGNSVDPRELVSRNGVDGLRHYLLQKLAVYQDADFSEENLRAAYTKDLAHRLGNLISRLVVLADKDDFRPSLQTHDLSFDWRKDYDLGAYGAQAWAIIDRVNAEINEARPWELLKAGDREKFRSLITRWFSEVHVAAQALAPLLPESAPRIERLFRGERIESRVVFPALNPRNGAPVPTSETA